MFTSELFNYELFRCEQFFLSVTLIEKRVKMKKESMERERKVGVSIRMMNGAFKHRFTDDATALGLDEVSIMNGWILGYLEVHSDRDIYQKTLETDLGIGKSSVTSLVKLLESNGFITRQAVTGDARLKKIVLTKKGLDTAHKVKETLDEMEFSMVKNIDEKELEIFFKVSDRIRENLGDVCCSKK